MSLDESYLATLAHSGGLPHTADGTGQASPFVAKPLDAGLEAEQELGVKEDEQQCEVGEKKVPIVFHWDHGGNQVYICGSFNNWQKIQMSKR